MSPAPMPSIPGAETAANRFLTYLACPYSHPNVSVLLDRFKQVTAATVWLMRTNPGWNVFSPITHSHPLHVAGLDGDWGFWERIDRQYLSVSERLVVLTLPGWCDSVGVQAEIQIAQDMGIPIKEAIASHDGFHLQDCFVL